MKRPFANRPDDDFMEALEGRAASPAAIELARFAAGLREPVGFESADAASSGRGRARLLRFVEQRHEEKRRAGVGKFKGAAMSIAAIAGAGLVVAGAASGSNPVTLAVDVARDFSGPGVSAPAADHEYSFEAEVVASDEWTLDVLLEGRTIRVEPETQRPSDSGPEEHRLPAFEAGTVVRITGREPATDNVTATKIEVVPNSTKPSGTALAANTEVRTATSVAPVGTKAPAVIKTATPQANIGAAAPTRTPTPKPSPSPTPKPVLSAAATAIAEVEPNDVPAVDSATPAAANTDDDQNAPRPDPKVTAK